MVNTFVVSRILSENAKLLDSKRLGKQRVEAMQIINVLEGRTNKGWVNHPATKMWKGYCSALKVYCNYMIKEWVSRGFNNTMVLYPVDETKVVMPVVTFETGRTSVMINGKIIPNTVVLDAESVFREAKLKVSDILFPWWFCWDPFIYSHRASLFRKDSIAYAQLMDDVELKNYMTVGYIWPHSVTADVLNLFDNTVFATLVGISKVKRKRVAEGSSLDMNKEKSKSKRKRK